MAYIYEAHLKDGTKRLIQHPSPNASQKDIIDSLTHIGEGVITALIVKIIFKGKAK